LEKEVLDLQHAFINRINKTLFCSTLDPTGVMEKERATTDGLTTLTEPVDSLLRRATTGSGTTSKKWAKD
jgi:hypothetical protein